MPGYSFPDKLVVEFRAHSAQVWFSVELALAYQPGADWPELVEERRRPLPDWINTYQDITDGWTPTDVGIDYEIPLRTQLLPQAIAAGAIPTTNTHAAELGQHSSAVEDVPFVVELRDGHGVTVRR